MSQEFQASRAAPRGEGVFKADPEHAWGTAVGEGGLFAEESNLLEALQRLISQGQLPRDS